MMHAAADAQRVRRLALELSPRPPILKTVWMLKHNCLKA